MEQPCQRAVASAARAEAGRRTHDTACSNQANAWRNRRNRYPVVIATATAINSRGCPPRGTSQRRSYPGDGRWGTCFGCDPGWRSELEVRRGLGGGRGGRAAIGKTATAVAVAVGRATFRHRQSRLGEGLHPWVPRDRRVCCSRPCFFCVSGCALAGGCWYRPRRDCPTAVGGGGAARVRLAARGASS